MKITFTIPAKYGDFALIKNVKELIYHLLITLYKIEAVFCFVFYFEMRNKLILRNK